MAMSSLLLLRVWVLIKVTLHPGVSINTFCRYPGMSCREDFFSFYFSLSFQQLCPKEMQKSLPSPINLGTHLSLWLTKTVVPLIIEDHLLVLCDDRVLDFLAWNLMSSLYIAAVPPEFCQWTFQKSSVRSRPSPNSRTLNENIPG